MEFVKCPVCSVGRSTKKLSKNGPDAIVTFTAEGCEAVGLRHFVATGLSRKERVRVLTCHNCTMTCTVA